MDTTPPTESVDSPKPDGAILALFCYGAQNKTMNALPEIAYDAKLMFSRYQFVYRKIEVIEINSRNENEICFLIKRSQCDLINQLDLYITQDTYTPLFQIINNIQIESGGQRIDHVINQEQYDMNCIVFNRKPSHINNKSIYPIVMSPFHENNLVRPSTEYHDLILRIEFREMPCDVLFFGNIYQLDLEDREKFHSSYRLDNIIIGSCISKSHLKNKTMNGEQNVLTYSVDCFNHPMYFTYYYGFDKSKVTNIKLILNGYGVFYDGPIEALEYYKHKRGFKDAEPMMIFYSEDKFDKRPKSILNYSRLDSVLLEITTTQSPDEINLWYGGYNAQVISYRNGLTSLMFSK